MCVLFYNNSLLILSYHLSYLQKRKLDAVYYYMRSLAASNPILTAKESLMSLFEEAKRKVWHTSVLNFFQMIFFFFVKVYCLDEDTLIHNDKSEP